MRLLSLILLVAVSGACSRAKTYELQGQVIAVNRERREITIKHGDIRGFMPGMTMAFKVHDERLLQDREPGDLVKATLVVGENEAHLSAIERTGHAPLTEVPPALPDVLAKGEPVPDAALTDQDGRIRHISEWRGQAVAVTFVYTRCPLPDFCPAMDRNFAEVQRQIVADPSLRGRAHLLSVSFDPEHDTPAVLATHAARLGADPAHWTMLVADRKTIDAFGSTFGLSVIPGKPDAEIVHNLRTAVIDREGRLVEILPGNEWTPDDLLRHLRAAAR